MKTLLIIVLNLLIYTSASGQHSLYRNYIDTIKPYPYKGTINAENNVDSFKIPISSLSYSELCSRADSFYNAKKYIESINFFYH